ncbi:hydrogenase 2 maturation endopeptidase [Anatilimnocola aggregata]|uniref:Hydrogenase 2 maturation endopeptidase n=1 Tax=Anatilimnocola aggregata TaxID=2528021 RepID=A0A517YAI3_9BACT|nr:hydrogenase maturation protease [Anatilimnocola aggregata]QDU27201.1 hydrogenase 2 maturation endopeptidase [Anatilimnocola aggregata]
MTDSGQRASKPRKLAVGIGSPHGDDQIGWAVMRELAVAMQGELQVKTASQPLELLDWLPDLDQLIICDACQADGAPGDIYRWQWPTESLATCKRGGSHDLTLPFVLSLAEQLERLPQQVIVWGIELGDTSPGAPLSSAVRSAIPKIVKLISDDLQMTLSKSEPISHA